MSNWDIHIRHIDGTTERVEVSQPQPGTNTVVLASAPSIPIIPDPSIPPIPFILQKRPADTGKDPLPFLIIEKEPVGPKTVRLSVANYTSRLYANDHDLVDEEEWPWA
jgi:hypothetical protein